MNSQNTRKKVQKVAEAPSKTNISPSGLHHDHVSIYIPNGDIEGNVELTERKERKQTSPSMNSILEIADPIPSANSGRESAKNLKGTDRQKETVFSLGNIEDPSKIYQPNSHNINGGDGTHNNSNQKPSTFQFDNNLTQNEDKEQLKSFMTSSSISGENYFKSDEEESQQNSNNNNQESVKKRTDISNFKSYYVKFRWSQFFEFFAYHFLYYVILGPLTSLLIRNFGKSLPHNLIFTQLRRSCFHQTVFFFCTWLTYTLYFTLDSPNVYYQGEVMIVIAVIMTRCMVIAFKYATFDPVKIDIIRNQHLTYEEICSEFYLVDWFGQTDKAIHNETYFGLRVYDIDAGMFYIDFMVPPDKRIMENADKYVEDLKKHHDHKSPFEPPIDAQCKGNFSPTRIYGYAIMKEFSMAFERENGFIKKYVCYFSASYSLFRALTPMIFRFVDKSDFSTYQWHEILIIIVVAINTFQIYFYAIWQLISGFLDIKRKVFQQNQLAFMISPRKLRTLDCKKVFPTINIFKMNTLKGWQCIRQVCIEYGKSYFLRVQALFSAYFLFCMSMLSLLALGIFKVITLEKPMTAIIISDIFAFLLLIFPLIYFCAQANSMFLVHENILKGNKSICSDIYRNRSFWFREGFRSTNFIYNKGVEKIKEECEMLQKFQECDIGKEDVHSQLEVLNPVEYTLELIRDYEEHIQELNFDSLNNPVKLLGVTITFGLLQSVFITLASVIATLVASYFSDLTKKQSS